MSLTKIFQTGKHAIYEELKEGGKIEWGKGRLTSIPDVEESFRINICQVARLEPPVLRNGLFGCL